MRYQSLVPTLQRSTNQYFKVTDRPTIMLIILCHFLTRASVNWDEICRVQNQHQVFLSSLCSIQIWDFPFTLHKHSFNQVMNPHCGNTDHKSQFNSQSGSRATPSLRWCYVSWSATDVVNQLITTAQVATAVLRWRLLV